MRRSTAWLRGCARCGVGCRVCRRRLPRRRGLARPACSSRTSRRRTSSGRPARPAPPAAVSAASTRRRAWTRSDGTSPNHAIPERSQSPATRGSSGEHATIRASWRSMARCSTGTSAPPGSCPGDPPTRVRGRSSSARSCCSRRQWRAYCLPTTRGSRAGPGPRRSLPIRRVRRCGRGASSATRAGRCACTSARRRWSSVTQARCPRTSTRSLCLPGVGAYTARAVATFAFGQRQPVVDTNVRRVVARLVRGRANAGSPATAQDLAEVEALLPSNSAVATRVSAALMELGALVCTARAPRCAACPLATGCAWRLAGSPPYDGPTAGLNASREPIGRCAACCWTSCGPGHAPVERARLDAVWTDRVQRDRALAGLIADGLVDARSDGRFALPGTERGVEV